MQRATYRSMVAELAGRVEEILPWDLVDEIAAGGDPLLLDIRCPHEFAGAHIPGSINVPRGILESAVDYGYDETEPELAEARERRLIVICRSGNRSILAAHTLKQMGFRHVASLKTGLRGWNDYEQSLVDVRGSERDPDELDALFNNRIPDEKRGPAAGRRAS